MSTDVIGGDRMLGKRLGVWGVGFVAAAGLVGVRPVAAADRAGALLERIGIRHADCSVYGHFGA